MQNVRSGLSRHAAFIFLKAKALFSIAPIPSLSSGAELVWSQGCGPGAQSDCAGLSNILKVL